jgi:hypothetical protein
MCEFKRFYIFYRVKSLQKIRWFTTDGLRQFKRNGRRYINLKLYGRSKSTVVESKAIREKSLLPSFFRASFNPTNILRKTLKSLTHFRFRFFFNLRSKPSNFRLRFVFKLQLRFTFVVISSSLWFQPSIFFLWFHLQASDLCFVTNLQASVSFSGFTLVQPFPQIRLTFIFNLNNPCSFG